MGEAPQSLLVIFFVLSGLSCYSSDIGKRYLIPHLKWWATQSISPIDLLNSNPEERYTISIIIKDEEWKYYQC